jgi:hypothetical protein
VIAVGDGKLNKKGERIPLDVKARRHRHLQQVRRNRGQGRRRGVSDPQADGIYAIVEG